MEQNHNSLYLFKDVSHLLGTTSSNRETTVRLDAEEHVFPFSFRVPNANLPASFQGLYGHVRYDVSAVLVLNGWTKRVLTIPVTIPSTLDVDSNDLQTPKMVSENGKVGLFWWKSGNMNIEASLPRSGYSSEQIAPLTINILNHSSHSLVIKDVCLKQRVTYKTFDESRGPLTERIHKLKYTECIDGVSRKITRVINFPIPSANIISPTVYTPILQVTHAFTFKVKSKATLSKVCRVDVPVVIGGFPYDIFDNAALSEAVELLPVYEAPPTTTPSIPRSGASSSTYSTPIALSFAVPTPHSLSAASTPAVPLDPSADTRELRDQEAETIHVHCSDDDHSDEDDDEDTHSSMASPGVNASVPIGIPGPSRSKTLNAHSDGGRLRNSFVHGSYGLRTRTTVHDMHRKHDSSDEDDEGSHGVLVSSLEESLSPISAFLRSQTAVKFTPDPEDGVIDMIADELVRHTIASSGIPK